MRSLLFCLCFILQINVYSQSSDNPYDSEEGTSEGMTKVKYKGKYGFLNEKRQEVIAVQYLSADDFKNGLAKVSLNKKEYGYIDKQGKIIIPLKYEAFKYGFLNGYTPAQLQGKWGMITDKGKIIIPHQYDFLDHFKGGLAVAGKGGVDAMLFGYLDERGNEVIPFKFTKASLFSGDLASVQYEGKYGFIDKKGNVKIPFQYEQTGSFSDGLAAVAVNKKWGFIDNRNNMILKPVYEKAYSYNNGEAEVKLNGQSFYINKAGERLKKGKWLMLFTKGLKLGEQYWFRGDKLDSDGLYSKYQQGFRYTHQALNLHEKEIFVIMSKGVSYSQRGLYNYNAYDKMWKDMEEYVSSRNNVTSVAYGHGKWSWIGSNLGAGKSEVVFSNRNFPEADIEKQYKEKKFITSMAYGEDRWVIGMRKENYDDQKIVNFDFEMWDNEEVEKYLKNGYAITDLVKKEDVYTIVFTKGTGIKEQLLLWQDEIPVREIKSYWDKGWKSYKTFYVTRESLIDIFDF